MSVDKVPPKTEQKAGDSIFDSQSPRTSASQDTSRSNQSGADGTVFQRTGTTGEPDALVFQPLQVNYGSYHDGMHEDLNNLAANPDAKTLAPVVKDTDWWVKYDQSQGNATLATTLSQQEQTLQGAVASGDSAAAIQATSALSKTLIQSEDDYYIAHHPKGTSPGGPTGPGDPTGPVIKPPEGATTATDSDPSQWTVHLGTAKNGIGGSGDVQNATVTSAGKDAIDYSTTGGAWGDSIIGASTHFGTAKGDIPADSTHFQTSATVNFDSSYIKNGNMFEKDMIVTDKSTDKQYVIGTQIDPKNGDVYYWNQQQYLASGHKDGWVNEGSITGGEALKANTNYNLELDAHITNGQYVYDNYSLNGKSLDPKAATTFNVAANVNNWSSGFVAQSQEDLDGNAPKGTTISAIISNEKVTAW